MTLNRLFALLQYLVPQHLLSRTVGYLADSRVGWIKNTLILFFLKRYGINMAEAEQSDPFAFANFNAFFTRALKAGARPIAAQPEQIACPADGAISQLGGIDYGRLFQAKGHSYSLTTLLGGDSDTAALFTNGSFATIYLSPKDYHRVHMPLSGTLKEMVYVPGDLFSVNQATVSEVPNLFARNERLIAIFDTAAGPMAVILVGAMIVAGIETVWSGQVSPKPRQVERVRYDAPPEPISLEKGAEMGRFKLGSTVILLFAKDSIEWDSHFMTDSDTRMGETLGQLLEASGSDPI